MEGRHSEVRVHELNKLNGLHGLHRLNDQSKKTASLEISNTCANCSHSLRRPWDTSAFASSMNRNADAVSVFVAGRPRTRRNNESILSEALRAAADWGSEVSERACSMTNGELSANRACCGTVVLER